jgi:hypothetical protein
MFFVTMLVVPSANGGGSIFFPSNEMDSSELGMFVMVMDPPFHPRLQNKLLILKLFFYGKRKPTWIHRIPAY